MAQLQSVGVHFGYPHEIKFDAFLRSCSQQETRWLTWRSTRQFTQVTGCRKTSAKRLFKNSQMWVLRMLQPKPNTAWSSAQAMQVICNRPEDRKSVLGMLQRSSALRKWASVVFFFRMDWWTESCSTSCGQSTSCQQILRRRETFCLEMFDSCITDETRNNTCGALVIGFGQG